jgi:Fur family peroxide stress response transcriptional regulator
MNPSLNSIRDLFRRNHIRCTRQRELLYSALAASDAHPTADELLRMARDRDAALSLATVYNTLDLFLAHGLCRKITSTASSGPCRYDAVIHDHAHGVMPDGQIIDLPADLSHRIVASLSSDLRKEVESVVGARIARIAVELVFAQPDEAPRANAPDHAEHAI